MAEELTQWRNLENLVMERGGEKEGERREGGIGEGRKRGAGMGRKGKGREEMKR